MMKIEAFIEKKRKLEDQIQQTKNSIGRLPNMHSKIVERNEWKSRLDNLVARCGNDMNKVMETRAADYRQIQNTVEQLSNEIQREQARADEAKQHLAGLEAELASLEIPVSLKELLAMLQKNEQAESAVAELEGLISEQQSKIDLVNSTGGANDTCSQLLASLHEQKEDLLAEIACGKEVDKKQLDLLDRQIAEATQERDEHVTSTATAARTINGLQRKLSVAQHELKVAKRNYLDAVAIYLEKEIELAGSEYVKISGQFAAQFMRVVALAELRGKIGKPINVFGTYTGSCKIPSFATDSCKENEMVENPGLLFKYTSHMASEHITVEVARLHDIGLKLPL